MGSPNMIDCGGMCVVHNDTRRAGRRALRRGLAFVASSSGGTKRLAVACGSSVAQMPPFLLSNHVLKFVLESGTVVRLTERP